MRRAIQTLPAALVLVPSVALAHTGHGGTIGLMHGFTHPITGIDHVLAALAVGVLAAQLGGRALWLVPLTFVSVMMIAGVLGTAGIRLPLAELGIALSVVVLGLAISFSFGVQVPAAITLVGFFAVFHGYAHGTEMPVTASALPYAAGFVGATALLHSVGVCLGLLFGLVGRRLGHSVVRLAGGAMAMAGAAILVRVI